MTASVGGGDKRVIPIYDHYGGPSRNEVDQEMPEGVLGGRERSSEQR
jgi:hypothetical protein